MLDSSPVRSVITPIVTVLFPDKVAFEPFGIVGKQKTSWFVLHVEALDVAEDVGVELVVVVLLRGTLVFVESYAPITNATSGLLTPDILGFASSILYYRKLLFLGMLAVFTAGAYLYVERVARSPLGRTLRAMRDNEVSSEALGKNNTAIRRNILIVGSALSGISGVLVVTNASFISPETFTRTYFTFYPFVIVILGGAANNFAMVVGSVIFEGIIDITTNFQTFASSHSIYVPVDLNAVTPIAIGALLIVVLLWRPRGLISEKPTLTLEKSDLIQIKENAKKAGSAESPESKVEGSSATVSKHGIDVKQSKEHDQVT
jgi:branched-chain amino acid transport system permease protein